MPSGSACEVSCVELIAVEFDAGMEFDVLHDFPGSDTVEMEGQNLGGKEKDGAVVDTGCVPKGTAAVPFVAARDKIVEPG